MGETEGRELDDSSGTAERPGGQPFAPYRHRAARVLVVTALAVLLVDVVSKQVAVAELTGNSPVRLFGGALYLVLTRNSGAAFSIARDYTFVFPMITTVVVGWIVWTARRLRSVPWGVALGLVLGGATGNLVDRVFRAPGPLVGHVVDFFSLLDERGEFFPVFNVADMSLVSGVALAILLELTGRRRDGTRDVGIRDDGVEDGGPEDDGTGDTAATDTDREAPDTDAPDTDAEAHDTGVEAAPGASAGAGRPGRDRA